MISETYDWKTLITNSSNLEEAYLHNVHLPFFKTFTKQNGIRLTKLTIHFSDYCFNLILMKQEYSFSYYFLIKGTTWNQPQSR